MGWVWISFGTVQLIKSWPSVSLARVKLAAIQYRSNVSYHRLARNKTRIARNETHIARNKTCLAGNENCLMRNFSFLASALQVPTIRAWRYKIPLLYFNSCSQEGLFCVEKSLSGHVSYCWFFRWDKHGRCATGVQYFLALSGQFLFYMYWSTWSAFVLSVRLSWRWNFALDIYIGAATLM